MAFPYRQKITMQRKRRWLLMVVLVSVLLLVTYGRSTPAPEQPLQVRGNVLVHGANQHVFLMGVSDSGLEYTCDPTYQRQLQPEQFHLMRSWGINTVRLSLSAPYWLNTRNSCPNYHTAVNHIIHTAEANGLYVILTLAWIAPFAGGYSGGAGYPMVDRAEALPFWFSVANAFAHDQNVLFELYSEPHDITWQVWRDGGEVITTDTRDNRVPGTYTALGMQDIVTLVNALAPERILFVSGIEWGGDLTAVQDTARLNGHNIAYSIHLYPGPNSMTSAQWTQRFGVLARSVPVVATEFGQLDCGHDFLDRAMPYLITHTQGMLAWTWDIGDCGRPGMLTDWQGDTTPYGAIIKTFITQQHRSE